MRSNPDESAEIRILSIHATQNGKIAVGARVQSGENSEKREFYLLDEFYMQLGIEVGVSDEKTVATLERADALSSAVSAGMNSLNCGDCTCRGLAVKLIRKGYRKEIAENAVKFLKSKGYIDEISAVERAVSRYAEKLWGSIRITVKLYEDGYGERAIKRAEAVLADIDFVSSCMRLIEKKYGELPNDTEMLKKIKAALMRYGYTSAEINSAMRNLNG